jgi:hypothetical protein
MFLDWAVRGALFYWRMVSGRWLWKYPRPVKEAPEERRPVAQSGE